jgi:hypothetical protein
MASRMRLFRYDPKLVYTARADGSDDELDALPPGHRHKALPPRLARPWIELRTERGRTLSRAVLVAQSSLQATKNMRLQLFDGYVDQIAGLYLVRQDR